MNLIDALERILRSIEPTSCRLCARQHAQLKGSLRERFFFGVASIAISFAIASIKPRRAFYGLHYKAFALWFTVLMPYGILPVMRIVLDAHAIYSARLTVNTIKSLAPPVTAI